MNDGFDDIQKQLKQLQQQAKELDGTQEVPFGELTTNEFMRSYTQFETIDEFFDASEWSIDTMDDLEPIPEEHLNRYVDEYTEFPDWHAMMEKAGAEYVARRLGI